MPDEAAQSAPEDDSPASDELAQVDRDPARRADDDDVVDVHTVERVAEVVARKLILELRDNDSPYPDPHDLKALADYPEVYRDFMTLYNRDLERRWEHTNKQQAHEHEMERSTLEKEYGLASLEQDAIRKALLRAPWFAIVFGLGGLVAAVLLGIYAAPLAGAIVGGLNVTTGIGLFMYAERLDRDQSPPTSQESKD